LFFNTFTERLAKDRSACDLLYISKYHFCKVVDAQELEFIYKDSTKPLIDRCVSGWGIVGGKKIKHPHIPEGNDNIERYIEVNRQLNIPENLLSIIKTSHKIHHEEHLFGFGICYNQFVKEHGQTIKNFTTGDIIKKIFVPEVYIDNQTNEATWVSAGLDYHTKEGKSAIYSFIKNKEIKQLLTNKNIPYDLWVNLIGHSLFRLEGHEVNERLFYPTANTINNLVNDFYQNKYNTDINNIKKIIYSNIDSLNNLRNNIYSNKMQNKSQKMQ